MEINPYSPAKVLVHYERWKTIQGWHNSMVEDPTCQHSFLPRPITVSVDLANKCNMKCIDCNADFLLKKEAQTILDKKYLENLTIALQKWQVSGVCLGGGGDSTLNPNLGFFVEELHKKYIKAGMVSNGLLIHKFPELQRLIWLGVSVDAGTSKIWQKVHGMENSKLFELVLHNMQQLIRNGVDVTYKYLLRPENVKDVYNAIGICNSIGCRNFHIRPMASPWFDDPTKQLFKQKDVNKVSRQLERAKKDFPLVNIVGVFNKLGKEWKVEHPFEKCWAIFASCVFLSNRKVGLCCDLRGCPTVEVGPYDNPQDFIDNFWGSREHFNIQKQIDINKCSRCTFSFFNKMFEEAIINDGFMKDFI